MQILKFCPRRRRGETGGGDIPRASRAETNSGILLKISSS